MSRLLKRRVGLLLDRIFGCDWAYYRNPYRTDVRQCRRCHRVGFL
jgi:hypothetical protein